MSEDVATPARLGEDWRQWWDYERTRAFGGGPIAKVSQIARRWEVLRELVVRGLKSSYGSSVLGYAWTLFTPLSLIAVYWMVFGHVVRLGLTHYPLFVAAGMMPWVYFNSTINASMNALRGNSGIIRTINMPREIFPLSVVGESCVEYLLSLPVVLVLGLAYGILPDRYVALLPLSIIIETVLLIGLSLLLSALTTLVRDTQRVIRPILRVLFYLTPIVYPISRVSSGIASTLYRLNPLVGIIDLNRLAWYPHYLITPKMVFQQVGISAGVSVALFVIGWATFARLEPATLKEL